MTRVERQAKTLLTETARANIRHCPKYKGTAELIGIANKRFNKNDGLTYKLRLDIVYRYHIPFARH